mmetsp:Transcript_34053/g.43925  ORF Transcript_34053/g.43925 Transcript_34053/m.43925 type:complete len:629 (+) Transcript_34053:109-1995(+)
MDDPVARARAIAARLSGAGEPSIEPVRKRSRWGDDGGSVSTPTSGSNLQLALAVAQPNQSETPARMSASAAVAAAMMAGMTKKAKKKIYIPTGAEFGDIDFRKLLIGPRGTTQKAMEEKFNTRILIRGRGSTKDGSVGYGEDDNDDLHVCVEGDAGNVDATAAELERIMSSPEAAAKLKADQLNNLAQMNGSQSALVPMGGGGGGHYGPSGGSAPSRPDLGFGGQSYGGDDEISERVEVPNNMVGLVIGKGGETIQAIQRNSGCHVQVARESEIVPGSTTRFVNLRGNPAAMEKAKNEIDRILNDRTQGMRSGGQSAYGPASDNSSVTVKVPNSQVGLVIGKAGVTVKAIQERTSTTVQIPSGPDDDDNSVRTLTIVGPSLQGCNEAAAEIEKLVADRMANMGGFPGGGHEASTPNVLVIKNEYSGAVIGKGGTTIRGIQERSGARVQIPSNADPNSHPPTRTITISGPRDAQERAVHEITEAIYQHGGPGGQSLPHGTSISPEETPYGGGYDAYGGYSMYNDPYSMYQQQQQAYYQQPVEETAAPVDMTAYYNDFWQYFAAYGEKLAREYYGDWSPPVGTEPPAGIVAPETTPDMTATEAPEPETNQVNSPSEASDAPPPPPPPDFE